MLGTMSNPGGNADVAVANAVLADATAKGYCKVMGVQWGMSDANQVTNLKSRGAGIPIWLSEHKCGGQPGANVATAPNDYRLRPGELGLHPRRDQERPDHVQLLEHGARQGREGHRQHARVGRRTRCSWRMRARSTQTPAYYVFRHVSQYVAPGAKRIDATGGDAVAFKNPDGSLVAVMYNSGAANNSYVVAIGGKKLQFAMPASGWATVKFAP